MKKYGIIVLIAIVLLSTGVYSLNTVDFSNNQIVIDDNNNYSQSDTDVINESTVSSVYEKPLFEQIIYDLQNGKIINTIEQTVYDSQGNEYKFVGYIDSTPSYQKVDDSTPSNEEVKPEGLLEALAKERNIPYDSGRIYDSNRISPISFVCNDVCVNFNFIHGFVSSITNQISPDALRNNGFERYENCTLNEGNYVNITSPTTMDASGNYVNIYWPTVNICGPDGVTCYNYTGYTVSQQTHIKCGDNIYEKLPGFNDSFVVEKYVPYEQYNQANTNDIVSSEPVEESDTLVSNNISS